MSPMRLWIACFFSTANPPCDAGNGRNQADFMVAKQGTHDYNGFNEPSGANDKATDVIKE